MDLIAKEIARKKATAERVSNGRTFFKRSQLAAAEEIEYLRKTAKAAAATRENEIAVASSSASTKNVVNNLGGDADNTAPTAPALDTTADTTTALPQLGRAEVTRRLRRRGEPIKLFGESLEDARLRLRELELTAPEAGEGFGRNDMLDHMANVDDEFLQELLAKRGHEGMGSEAASAHVPEPRYSWEDMLSYRDQLGVDENKNRRLVRRFLRYLLDSWARDLALRPEEERRTTEGRTASATLKQTRAYVQPLLVKLKDKTVDPNVLAATVTIMQYVLNGEYLKASDSYLQFAIGKAAWPIGVTNVGIHSRSGREKLFAHHIAHVLNDDVSRKYIWALKRLMTYAQQKHPADPSKSLEYNGAAKIV